MLTIISPSIYWSGGKYHVCGLPASILAHHTQHMLQHNRPLKRKTQPLSCSRSETVTRNVLALRSIQQTPRRRGMCETAHSRTAKSVPGVLYSDCSYVAAPGVSANHMNDFSLICRFGMRRRVPRQGIQRSVSAIKRSDMPCTANLHTHHSSVSAVCLWAAG